MMSISPSKSVDGPSGGGSSVIDFPLVNYWKVMKLQRDLESSQIGFCNGFYFRILVHPRTSNDPDSSYLSVFLEALKKPWFPDDWLFPNVRFDLTVVNWKNPRDNVNSWAHWTFCEDTTSRGWQRMLSQTRISKARGFLDADDTLLIRGRAEPLFWGPWSRKVLTFLPKGLWGTRALTGMKCEEVVPSTAKRIHCGTYTSDSLPAVSALTEAWHQLIPTLAPTIHSDYLSCLLHILYHVKDFRQLICSWQVAEDGGRVLSALQMTFGSMFMWPVLVGSSVEGGTKGLRDFLGGRVSMTSLPEETRANLIKLQPSCKLLLKALGLHQLSKMTNLADPIAHAHSAIFSELYNLTVLTHLEEVLHGPSHGPQASFVDKQLETMFGCEPSTTSSGIGSGSYTSSFIRIRHLQSLPRALSASGRLFRRLPNILFVYAVPHKSIKKGELFDVPLRLEASLLQKSASEDSEKWYCLLGLIIRDGEGSPSTANGSAPGLAASQGFYTILRPDEEGPWFRIHDGRAEKLQRAVFSEWKCHRDFFCAAAVYVAENYLDSRQDFTRPTDVNQANPRLFSRVLSTMGVPGNYLETLRAFSLGDRWSQVVSMNSDAQTASRAFSPFVQLNQKTSARGLHFLDRSLLTVAMADRDVDGLERILRTELFDDQPPSATDIDKIRDAAKKAAEVANAVQEYLETGGWNETRQTAKQTLLESWVTRQVSVVWDLMSALKSNDTSFADVFCLAILESVEVRVLRDSHMSKADARGSIFEDRLTFLNALKKGGMSRASLLRVFYGSNAAQRKLLSCSPRQLLLLQRRKRRLPSRHVDENEPKRRRSGSNSERSTVFPQQPPESLEALSQRSAHSFDPDSFPLSSEAPDTLRISLRTERNLRWARGVAVEESQSTSQSDVLLIMQKECLGEHLYAYIAQKLAEEPGVRCSRLFLYSYGLAKEVNEPRWRFLNPKVKLKDRRTPTPNQVSAFVAQCVDLHVLVVLTSLSPVGDASASATISHCVAPRVKSSKGSKRGGRKQKAVACVQQSNANEKITHATAEDDLMCPLILLKVFDPETVDMLYIGAATFDCKMCIHDIVTKWVVQRACPSLLRPLVQSLKERKLLKENCNLPFPTREIIAKCLERTDASQLYSVAEECGACGNPANRDFQLARRLGSNLRKLGKRTGDVLVVQFRPNYNDGPSLPPSLLENLKGRRLDELVDILQRPATQDGIVSEEGRERSRSMSEVSLDQLVVELRRRRSHSEETEGSTAQMSIHSAFQESLPTAPGNAKISESKILRRKKRAKGKSNSKVKRRPARADVKVDGSVSSEGVSEAQVVTLALTSASILAFLKRCLRAGQLPHKWKIEEMPARSKRCFSTLHNDLIPVAVDLKPVLAAGSLPTLQLLDSLCQNMEEGVLSTTPEKVCCNELEYFHPLLSEKTFALAMMGAILVTGLTDTAQYADALSQLVSEERPVMPLLLLICAHWTIREMLRDPKLEYNEAETIMEALFKISGTSSVTRSSVLRRCLRFVYRTIGPLSLESEDKPEAEEVDHVCHVNTVRRCQSVSIDIVYGEKSSLLGESDEADSEDVELRSVGSSSETKDVKPSFCKDDDWTPSTATPNNKLKLRVYRRHQARRPIVHKDEPQVVRESDSWIVVFKPAFWHCSGPSQMTDLPLDIQALRAGRIEDATANITLNKLQKSGRMESFHLWMMKRYPTLETVQRWGELECGLCHRIDLETSGALLIAKTSRSRDLIWEQFRRRYVHKEYLLLCHGRLADQHGTVKTRLLTRDYGTNKSRKIKSHFTTVVAEGGELAITEYQVSKIFKRRPWPLIVNALRSTPQKVGEKVQMDIAKAVPPGCKDDSCIASANAGNLGGRKTLNEEFTLCKCRIVTGRTHQIRVHMRHIGHPLVSDTKYLDAERCQEDRYWCPRMFLHAAALEFADPDTHPGTFTEVICPLAHELVQAITSALTCTVDYEDLTPYGLETSTQPNTT